jgi:FkbH-like protein
MSYPRFDISFLIGTVGKKGACFSSALKLIGKTNQFNVTTRRHAEADVRRMLSDGAIGLTLNLKDRYGDYGLVGVLLATSTDTTSVEVDTFLLSCRVMNRTVEHFMFNTLINVVRDSGFERASASYIPTLKNQPVAELYPSLGFTTTNAPGVEGERYTLDIAEYIPLNSRIVSAETSH